MSTIDPNCSEKCLYSVEITNHDNKQLATWVHGTTCPPFVAINYIFIPLPALTKHPHHFFCIESCPIEFTMHPPIAWTLQLPFTQIHQQKQIPEYANISVLPRRKEGRHIKALQ
jgi:hypothetical protein